MLRSADFRKVYDGGFRFSCQNFAAFCLSVPDEDGPRIGFTVSRAMGKSVARNRMRRRMREAVRHRLSELNRRWWIVFNPRKAILDTSKEIIERDVKRLFLQCENS